MALVTIGLSHRTAPLAMRERAAFTESELPDALARLRALCGVNEAAILSTCNRTELFAVADPESVGVLRQWWARERGLPESELERLVYEHRDVGSVQHCLRVAAGLDSMVVGEPQILGQVKQTFAIASSSKTLGPILSRLFQHTLAVAKLVRSRTQIGAHPVTIAYAAVQMARHLFSDLRGQTALLIGAGDTIQLLARHLQRQGVGRLVIANRSLDRAQKLARETHGFAVPLADMPSYLSQADLIVSGTSARGYVLDRGSIERAIAKRRHKPVFMIDLAVPRDIDPAVAALEDVYLYTVDDLRAVISENLKVREAAAQQAEVLVEDYAREFEHWLESRDAGETIHRIRVQARQHRDAVLDKARRRLASGNSPEEVLAFVADTLSNKLLHSPSRTLKSASAVDQAWLLSAAQKLFDLPEDDDAA
jgi:glutamyl-tRNA reductase